jgi:hypothetical protein
MLLWFDVEVGTNAILGEPANGGRVAFYPPCTGNKVDGPLYFGTWRHLVVDVLGYYSPEATDANGAGRLGNRHFIVGLGDADGAFKIYRHATSQLVIDLTGYFAP